MATAGPMATATVGATFEVAPPSVVATAEAPAAGVEETSGGAPLARLRQARQFGPRCPDCGGPLVYGEGCRLCPICGHSSCG